MRYVAVAILLSIGLIWDAVANESYYRLQLVRLGRELLRTIGY